MSFFAEKRREVMLHIEQYMLDMMDTYLKPIDTNWQPTDFLPVSTSDTFIQDIKSLRETANDLSYDLVAVLVGDTITEEALPTYESWLSMVDGFPVMKRGWLDEMGTSLDC
ncbi:acyl-ACP desaturase [Pedobacter sp. NJ-S-72]